MSGYAAGVAIAAYVFLPFYRYKNTTTAYEYLEKRFGPSIRAYGSIAFIVGQLVRISIILYLTSTILVQVTGWDSITCIILSGVFVGGYTIIGGIDAVIWTDVLQTIILVLGGVLCVGLIAYKLPGGLSQIFSVATEHGKFAFAEMTDGQLQAVSWNLSLLKKTGTMMLFIGLTNWLSEYGTSQNTVQRYCTSKSTKEARKAMLVCVCTSVPIWTFFMFLGTALFVYFQVFPSDVATEILNGTGGHKAEEIMPYFIMTVMPPGVAGIVIAAAIAAAMSSLDSSINAISTVGVVDIYRRHLNKNKNDRHYLKTAWYIASVSVGIMIVGAMVMTSSETKTLQHATFVISGLLSGGLLGMYLLGFLTRKGDARAVWIAIVFTIIFKAVTIFPEYGFILPKTMALPFDLYYAGILGNLIMFAVAFTAACLLPKKERDLTDLTVFDQK